MNDTNAGFDEESEPRQVHCRRQSSSPEDLGFEGHGLLTTWLWESTGVIHSRGMERLDFTPLLRWTLLAAFSTR